MSLSPTARGRATMLVLVAPALALLLAACDGTASGSTGPGAVSEGEARALDEAAEMLEERRLPDGTLPPTGLEASPGQPTPETTTEGTAEAE